MISYGIKSKFKFSLTGSLAKSAVWSRYLAIISIVTLGLSVLQTVIGLMKGVGSMASSILGLIISGVITFVMANNLLKFSSFTKSSMDTGDASQLNEGFYHLKIYFTIMGCYASSFYRWVHSAF
ncbi:MAG: hypothetical protein HWD58_14800 [Bacteroidota bacterium]|nr:MAG: hypothetical protein HWD58_14800 [Bacteroidota bacterium]